MAPISFLYVSILTPIFLALLSTFPAPAAAQDVGCLGYAGLPGEGNQCYIDPSTGTIMEAGVVAVGNCSDITLIATAIYTGIDAAVTAVASPEQDVGPEQNYEYADAFLYFDFPVPYEDVQDGSLVTFVVSYEFPGVTGRLAAGSSTVNKISTLVYTAATDTVIITADATTTLSSTTTSVITATVTPATTLIQTSPGPITTVTAKQPTTTTTVTITPAVSTRTHTVHTVTTTTLTCLGASSPSSSPAPTNRRLLNRPRGQTAGAPELLYCYTPGPNTTTIVTSAAVTTSTVTVTDTDVFFVGTTSQTTVTAPAPVSYKSGRGARTTVTPSSATSTKIMTAKASTVTVTSTSVRTVTALPSGKRTPKCPTSPVALVGAAITPTALMTVSA